MQNIQIDGTFTYIDNVKTLKLDEMIVLRKNPNNMINKEAVGAYTVSGKKIGYIPFKSSQIDINSKYKVTKINLTMAYPQILISREFEVGNIIQIESRDIANKIKSELYTKELKDFAMYLKHAGICIKDIGISYCDDNFINLFIQTLDNDEKNIFYTVTKKYYEEHVFYYDELYKFNLIPKCIFVPFQIHRIEIYIEKNYKPIEKLLKSKKIKSQLSNINNIIIEEIKTTNIELLFDNIKKGGLAYNHMLKAYCNIDMYNENNIIEITDSNYNMDEMILKCIIANKNIVNIFNSKKDILYKFTVPGKLKTSLLGFPTLFEKVPGKLKIN